MAGYENLDVYKLAFELAVEIQKVSSEFPKSELYGGITDQMRRSSRGICANLAEGLSKRMSPADEYKFLSVAIGSAEETRVWLSFCERFEYLEKDEVARLRDAYARVCQMIYGLQQKRKVD